MKNSRNILIGLLFALLFLMSGFFYVQIRQLKKANRALMAQLSRSRAGAPNGRAKDPYKDVAVPNTLQKRAPEIRQCYLSYLKSNPKKTDGRIELDWQIDESGTPSRPEVVRSDLPSKELSRCLTDTIGKIRFPPPPYGGPVYYVHKYTFQKTED